MTEAFSHREPKPTNAEIIPIDPAIAAETNVEDRENLNTNQLWPLLDSRMNLVQISEVSRKWDSSRVFAGKGNAERPRAALEWMLTQTHVTVDASREQDIKSKLAERDRLKSRGGRISKALSSIHELSPSEERKLELAREVNLKINKAQKRVEDEASKGLSNLLDFIDTIDEHVISETSDSNIVRLFNAIDHKTGGRDRDLILAKRTLIVMLANELVTE